MNQRRSPRSIGLIEPLGFQVAVSMQLATEGTDLTLPLHLHLGFDHRHQVDGSMAGMVESAKSRRALAPASTVKPPGDSKP